MLLGYRLHSSQKDPSYAREFLYLLTETLRHVWSTLFTHEQLFWMAIVAEHSLGRVRQEEGERNGDAFRFSNGTDPALQTPLRTTYTTRPSQDLSDQYKSDRNYCCPLVDPTLVTANRAWK
uniref:Myotubularin phosphatase domain-containing protein n=1 Tax=Heterorhabditis bacteriophora TaxID=37862 RepID=A0A1I7WKI8_HETBA